MDWVSQRPQLTEEQVVALALERFGLDGRLEWLDGERDQNARLHTARGSFVLKLSNPLEEQAVVELQNEALRRLAQRGVPGVPLVVAGLDGADIQRVNAGTDTLLFRALSWIDGLPLATVKPHGPELLQQLGERLATIDEALEGLTGPAAHRSLHWDVKHAATTIEERLSFVQTPARRTLIKTLLSRFERRLSECRPSMREQLIQSDANDWNVMVRVPSAANAELSGIIDFGDMVHSWRAAEPAICGAYVMLNKRRPLRAFAHVVRGYHRKTPLLEAEMAMLWDLAMMRLCTSVCMAAEQRLSRPDDAYLGVTESAAWSLLEESSMMLTNRAHYVLRDACGFEPHPARVAVCDALERRPAAPLLGGGVDLARLGVVHLDVEAADAPGSDERLSPPVLPDGTTPEVWAGRYAEPRLCYDTPAFVEAGEDGPERRTLHIGVDVFAPAGQTLFAPEDGVVAEAFDHDAAGDYGPTIVLEHATEGGKTFWSLFGHLSRQSLTKVKVGDSVRRGQPFAAIGEPHENGGWQPHVHVQLLLDPLGLGSDFPGVANPLERNVWTSLCPSPADWLGLPAEVTMETGSSVAQILESRKDRLGPSLSVSYDKPLKIVRGRGAYLYDDDGRDYLDCVNNVCHVGHCHPRVVEAAMAQMRALNTNTRYLHDNIVEYAERLAALFPPPLDVCFFVCSGSEANELALRLARTFTERQDLVCLDAGYHGNTQLLVDISPYKHSGPGGRGAPEGVFVAPLADPYRGRHRDEPGDQGALYAADLKEQLAKSAASGRGGVAAFIHESIPGCGGQIVLPEGYLRRAYEHVRAAGGLCIADEVQVGFGRVGSHWWAFEEHGVVPDIVTLGKPIGNGHPLGAVVTTRAVAQAFHNGMEYFNTFGGNPVSCAVGMSVLDVIEQESLREKADRTGRRLLHGLKQLQTRFEIIGDVRGRGLFVGAELVLDRATRRPAPKHAKYIAERMRDARVLISTDGPDHNVLKLKPPMVISESDVDRLLARLEAVLGETPLQRPAAS